MKEESLKIIELKQCRKKANKLLVKKFVNMSIVALESFCFCTEIHEFVEKRSVWDLAIAFGVLYWYYECLKNSRKNTEDIDKYLDEELDLIDIEEKGLSK